ncbi:hypothetical protein Acr_18g0006490 [Actinidia rufa]|uniref:CCHC-type domain-containing protein n=1 Tax=Actinidia rufa TaxID=165716 RepID=A0A7J0G6S7_9ERIC|nr:hypothetical protein Acr_18g0006490 [Actinidia rufa]
MPPRRGRGRRGAAEPEDRVDRIERILEGLVQVVHDVHNNNNHDEAPQQPAMPMPGARAMPHTTIKQFQQLRPPTFYGTPDPMAAESWLLGIERARRFEVGLRWNIKNKVEILRLPTHQEVLHAALIAKESLNEMSQFRENRKKRIGGNMSRGQSTKRQSSGSSSGNSSAQQGNIVSQGSSRSNELPTCPTCQKKHWGECRMGSRACYGCGQEGHQIRDCPMKSKNQGAGTSASASIRQPPAFALVPGNTPATTSVVSGILPICGQPAHILMDSGSTHSFVSNSFEHYLTTSPVSLEYELSVSLPSGDSMLCDRVYNSCEIRVNDVPMYVDLIPLEMHGFDVILGIDWLSSYRALIDCELKRVVFHSFAHSGLIFEGVGVVPPPYLISSMKARRLIQKGSQAFLCSIVDTHVSPPTLEDIHNMSNT